MCNSYVPLKLHNILVSISDFRNLRCSFKHSNKQAFSIHSILYIIIITIITIKEVQNKNFVQLVI